MSAEHVFDNDRDALAREGASMMVSPPLKTNSPRYCQRNKIDSRVVSQRPDVLLWPTRARFTTSNRSLVA